MATAFKPYRTHTGLLLHVDEEGEDEARLFVVYVTGTRSKQLLSTPDEAAAVKYANSEKKDYEARKKAEKSPQP